MLPDGRRVGVIRTRYGGVEIDYHARLAFFCNDVTMRDQLFHLPPKSVLTLQAQVREMLVGAILNAHIPGGEAVPSPRKLAEQLQIARNTVVLAYQQLVDEGYLIARERSGYYVAEDILDGRVKVSAPPVAPAQQQIDWSQRLSNRMSRQRNIIKPRDWNNYPYPFIYGQIDPQLFPSADWRDCCRQALSTLAIQDWAPDHFDSDDPLLIEQLHTRLLPRRGVWAEPEEILVTVGAQHALYLLASLLLSGKTIGMEEPGYPDARNIFELHAAQIVPLPVDAQGLQMGTALDACDYVYVTPSHQSPTTVTLSLERRQALLERARQRGFVIIEDDYESETNYAGQPIPALKSLDNEGRVIYVGSLSKTLAPGLRLGYMVGAEDLIYEARSLRRLMLRHPPANNERAIALFLARGHHDSLVRRLNHAFGLRCRTLGDALNHYLPESSRPPTFGGTSYWVHAPLGLDCRRLQREAASQGILIEPGDVFFQADPAPLNYFRLGFSAIPVDRIDEGIKRLAALVQAG